MQKNTTSQFDPETIALLKAALEQAWKSLAADEHAKTTRSLLAERILKQAATGEREREKLVQAALAGDLAA